MAEPEYLRLQDLHAFYGESHILHGVDLVVHRGECVSLLGRNGAGRTTILGAIFMLCLLVFRPGIVGEAVGLYRHMVGAATRR